MTEQTFSEQSMTEPTGLSDSDERAPRVASLTVTPPRGLSIPAKRLAGSPACLNCGTVLAGPFCHYCGQPDKNFLRFFPVLLREMLADFLDFDSRFARTMKPLLFHPGKLTRDYLDGRRFRYTPPLRLYIFASMAFFLVAAMLAGSVITISNDEDGEGKRIHLGGDHISAQIDQELDEAIDSGDLSETDAAELRRMMQRRGITEDTAESGTSTEPEVDSAATAGSPPAPEAQAQDTISEASEDSVRTDGEDTITINGKPWDREANPFLIPGAPDFINDWINNEIEESPQKGREIEANPNIIVDKVMDVLPIAVFIMLPLVALLLKFWYLFSGHYYIEHLIHALHNHAFLFVAFIMAILADAIAGLMEPETEGMWTDFAGWFDLVLAIWIPLYLLISLKKVYRQSWFMTLMKFSLVGVSYLVLLSLVAASAALAGFVLL